MTQWLQFQGGQLEFDIYPLLYAAFSILFFGRFFYCCNQVKRITTEYTTWHALTSRNFKLDASATILHQIRFEPPFFSYFYFIYFWPSLLFFCFYCFVWSKYLIYGSVDMTDPRVDRVPTDSEFRKQKPDFKPVTPFLQIST